MFLNDIWFNTVHQNCNQCNKTTLTQAQGFLFSDPFKWPFWSISISLHDDLCTLWQWTLSPFPFFVSSFTGIQEQKKTHISWTAKKPLGRAKHWQPIIVPPRQGMVYRHLKLWGKHSDTCTGKRTHTNMQHICSEECGVSYRRHFNIFSIQLWQWNTTVLSRCSNHTTARFHVMIQPSQLLKSLVSII